MTFLKNVWYCAGFAAELRDKPVGRIFLNEEVVLYRGAQSGKAYAVGARCPHRFAPLSMGTVLGDQIMCGYHGLRFDSAGRCAYNPHGGEVPPQTVLKTYPLTERAGILWIWMGDPARADVTILPESSFMTDPGYTTFTFYMSVAAQYELVTDNLLDLTHAPYIHAGTLSNGPAEAVMNHDFSIKGDVIRSNYHTPCEPPSIWFSKLFEDELGETFSSMTWHPASRLELDLWMRPIGATDAERVHTPSHHYLTPETERTTHYFNAQGRNTRIHDQAATDHAKELIRRGFLDEDAPMIMACQEYVGSADLFSLRPAILKTDTPAVQARRIIAKMARQEQEESTSSA